LFFREREREIFSRGQSKKKIFIFLSYKSLFFKEEEEEEEEG